MRALNDDSFRGEIRSVLASLRVRLRRDAWSRGVRDLWVVLPPLVVASLIAVGLGASPGWVAGISLILALAVVARHRVLLRRELEDDLALAAWAESRVPSLRTDLRASLQLVGRAPQTSEAAGLRSRLVQRVSGLVQRELATDEGLSRVLPIRDERRYRRVLLGSCAAALALFFLVPAARQGLVASGAGLGGGVERAVREEMLVGALSAVVTPPAYTGLPAEEHYALTSTLRVFEGSQVFLSGMVFEPVDAGWAVIGEGESAQRLALTIGADRRFSLELTPAEEQRVRFAFEIGKEAVRDSSVFVLSVARDLEPKIEITAPQDAVEVTGSEVVEIAYEVSDDFGVSGVDLVWYFVGAEEDESRLSLLGPSGTFAQDTAPFDVAPLYMQPGDEVMAYLEARDNRVVGGAQVVRSAPVVVRISEAPSADEELLAQMEQVFEELLAQLGAQHAVDLTSVEPDGDGGFRDVVIEDRSDEENATHVRALQQTLDAWPPILDHMQAYLDLANGMETIDPRAIRMMETLRTTLLQREREARRLVERVELLLDSGALPANRTSALARFHAQHIRDTERGVLALRTMISDHKADDVARSLNELSNVRDRIRDLLEQYRDTRDENLRARIERELGRLSQRMNELLEKIAAQVEELPQEHFNAEGMEQSEASENVQEMTDAMQSIRDRLNAGDVDGALAALDALDQTLDAMNQEFGDPFSNADDETLSAFDQAMGEVVDEVNAIEHAQQELERETSALQQELTEERRQALRETWEREIQRARDKVQLAQEQTARAMSAADDPALYEALESSADQLEQLRRRLVAQDFANAEDAALDAMQTLQQAASAAARARALTQNPDEQRALSDSERNAAQDAAQMREVSEAMSELQRNMRPTPNSEQQAQMQQMAGRQQSLQQRAQQLQERLGEVAQEFPMMGEGTGEALDAAREAMGEASGQLSQRQSGPAQSSQGRALDSLRDARQQIQQQMARQRAAQQQRQRGRGRTQNDQVEIPQEQARDLSQRQQIMDAMREGALEAWQDPVRQYYESLVR